MSGVVYPPRWANWVIRSFYWIFKIIGLATISLHSNPRNKRPLSFESFRLDRFYNLLLSCSLAALSYITLPNLFTVEYANKTPITSTIEIVQATFGVVMMCTILLHYVFRCSTVESVCNYLVHVEEQFRFSRTSISLKRTFRNLLLVFVVQTTLGATALLLEHHAFHDGPLVWATGILPATFSGSLFFQYFSVISLMATHFTRVNRSIRMLCNNLKPNDCWQSISRCRQIFDRSATVRSIRYLRNIHDDLCDVCAVISQFYSFPCLLVVASTFYALLFNSYYLLQPLVLPDKDFSLLAFLSTAFATVYLLCPLGILASKITGLLNEIERTAIVVHAFLKTTTDRETKSEVNTFCKRIPNCLFHSRVFFQLKQFSLQLLNRQIRFTASGYFNLDNSLFQSMLSTVVTYLVILIQYEAGNSSLNVCNCDCRRE
ncbi:putative gustatory receptor 2a [Halictus rubicundus]|uniref:putative gustatory receptor 2a n=1 Tax=Halictus rubicundus TaxID=77578 RepID=UPI004035EF5E